MLNLENTFNYHPPSIVQEVENAKEKFQSHFKTLKSNVRLFAKNDWRIFRLNYTCMLKETLEIENAFIDGIRRKIDYLKKEIVQKQQEATHLVSSIEDELKKLHKREENYSNMDFPLIERIAKEISALEDTLKEKQQQILNLDNQKQSLRDDLTFENKKSASLQIFIEQSKQLLDQHRVINEAEIEQQRQMLNFTTNLCGFKILKMNSTGFTLQTRDVLEIIFELTVNEMKQKIVKNITCLQSGSYCQFGLLLARLLKERLLSDEHQGPFLLECILKKANLLMHRFEKLVDRHIRKLQCIHVVYVDASNMQITVKKGNGELIHLSFDEKLTKIENLNKI